MKGFEMDSGDCTNIDEGAGFAGASCAFSSVSFESVRLVFTARVVERGNLTRGCLGGDECSTRNSSLPSLGEMDRADRVDVVVSETEAIDVNRAFVLSSCSSSTSRLGEINRVLFMIISRLLVLPSNSIGMTSCDSQEDKDAKS